MFRSIQPLQFLLTLLASWIDRRQIETIEYLKEKNRLLKDLCVANSNFCAWSGQIVHFLPRGSLCYDVACESGCFYLFISLR